MAARIDKTDTTVNNSTRVKPGKRCTASRPCLRPALGIFTDIRIGLIPIQSDWVNVPQVWLATSNETGALSGSPSHPLRVAPPLRVTLRLDWRRVRAMVL